MKNNNYRLLLVLLTILALTSCDWTKHKAKIGLDAAIEGGEFGSSLLDGVEDTFPNEIQLSNALKKQGLEIREVTKKSTDSTIDNILTVHFVFNKDFKGEVTLSLFDENSNKYGGLTQNIIGKKEEEKNIYFIFDKDVNIGVNGKIKFK